MTLLSPRFVGREADLAVLDDRLRAARAGQGGSVLVVGEAGVGKSRLVREAAARARAAGETVLVGRSVEAGAPWRPLAELLLACERVGLDRDHPSLREVRPGLSIVPGWGTGSGEATSGELLVGEAVVRAVRLLARRAVMMVIEDVHWADAPTRDAIAYLADHVDAERAVLIVTSRSTSWTAEARRSFGTIVELSGLAAGAVGEMVEACLGEHPPAGLMKFVVDRTDGLPFLVEELLAGLIESGSLRRAADEWVFEPKDEPSAPFAVVDSIAERLDRLDADLRDILRQAAVLGREIDVSLLAQASARGEDEIVRALRAGVQGQLLALDGGQFQFRHVLTRDAVRQSLPPSLHRELAARALQALLDVVDIEPATLRPAAGLAQVAGEDALAADLLLRLAEVELGRTHTATAAQAAREARDLAPAASDIKPRAERLLFEILTWAAITPEALELGHDVLARVEAEGGHGDAQAVRLLLARAAAVGGEPDSAERVLEELSAVDRARVPPRRVAEVNLIKGLVAMQRGDADRAIALASAAAADSSLQPAARCEALAVLGYATRARDPVRARGIFERELQLAQEARLALWAARALNGLGSIDLLTTLRAECLLAAREAAFDAGAPALVATVDLHLATLHVERMELDSAIEAARRARETAERLRLPATAMTWAIEAAALARAGRRSATLEAVGRAASADPDNAEVAAMTEGYALAVLSLVEDNVRQAHMHLDSAERYARALGDTPMPFRGLRALLGALRGDGSGVEAAINDARRQQGVNASSDIALLGAQAVVAGSSSTAATASELMEELDALIAQRERGAWLGHLCRALVAQAAIGDGWGNPAPWLRAALAEFEQRGHPHLAERCRHLLRQAGAPVPRRRSDFPVSPALAGMGVTAREAEVLALVARGASNREIAEELVVSPRTVEKHIENLMLKAGVPRSGLAPLAQSLGLSTG
jgi:DNA-binding CsgD family transcriptional regulator